MNLGRQFTVLEHVVSEGNLQRLSIVYHLLISFQKLLSKCVPESSVEFAQLEFLENFCSREDAGVNDASDCEGSPNYSTDGGEEVVERRPGLVVPHRDRVQVVLEPERRNDPASVAEGDVTPVSVGVLVGSQLPATDVLVRGGHDPHHVLVRFQVTSVQLTSRFEWVETGLDVLTANFPDLASK